MNVIEGLDKLPQPISATSLAIGTFDGVHLGHRAIIVAAVDDARRNGRPAVVVTFDRHPSELLAPNRAPGLITVPDQRNRLVAALGASTLVVLRFDEALSQLSPDSFIESILRDRLCGKSVVVGSSFCFGRGRSGDVGYLAAVQNRFEFVLHALDPVTVGGLPVSSTRIRELLRSGEIDEAEKLLGHSFLLAGTVVAGQRLGRTLGYPTANLAPDPRQVVPPDGIYAVRVTVENGELFGGACSIGSRPTIEGAGRSIETFLLDFEGDLYGRAMEIAFVSRLRDEQKFDSLGALTDQIARDVQAARWILEGTE